MNDSTDLKALWRRQESVMPDIESVFEKAKQYKKKNLIKLLATNLLLLATSVFIGCIWYFCQPQMLTTKIGISLVILAMAIYMLVYNQMLPLLLHAGDTNDTSHYLKNLFKIKAQQKFLLTTMLNLYYLMLSTGIFLYLLEFAPLTLNVWSVVVYTLSFGWILFSWFYFRKKEMKKREKTIDELINKFEAIERQLEHP